MIRASTISGFVLAAAVTLTAQGSPLQPITLDNGAVSLDLQPPDPASGFYRGTRFDWSGVISRLEHAGHRYFGPWFTRTSDVRDFIYDGDDIVAGLASAITGPVEEFLTDGSGLGFDETSAGGTFIKIGVGVLRRPDADDYSRFRTYEIVDYGLWTVSSTSGSASFKHELNDGTSGYGYAYEKVVSLVANGPRMTITHRLRNTGRKTIETLVYNHNFLVLDDLPTGPDFSIELPFAVATPRPPDPTLATIEGRRIRYQKALELRERVSFPIEGFGTSADDYRVTIENTRLGAGMRITGDRPLAQLTLWSIRSTIAVEPFVQITVAPGEEFRWQYVYTFYTGVPGIAR